MDLLNTSWYSVLVDWIHPGQEGVLASKLCCSQRSCEIQHGHVTWLGTLGECFMLLRNKHFCTLKHMYWVLVLFQRLGEVLAQYVNAFRPTADAMTLVGRDLLFPVIGNSGPTSSMWKLNQHTLKFNLQGPLPYNDVIVLIKSKYSPVWALVVVFRKHRNLRTSCFDTGWLNLTRRKWFSATSLWAPFEHNKRSRRRTAASLWRST